MLHEIRRLPRTAGEALVVARGGVHSADAFLCGSPSDRIRSGRRRADGRGVRAAGRFFATSIVAAALAAASAATAVAAEIIHADGRRVTVTAPEKDARGRWFAVVDGHRTALRPGDVVVIVDDAGAETVTIPPVADPPDAPDAAAALASLKDLKDDAWMLAVQRLGQRPTQAVTDALVALASDPKKELRLRAVGGLAALRTRESVTAAATAVLAEKDVKTRRDAASALFSVEEIFKRCDAVKTVAAGLADPDPLVRVTFASLAPLDDGKAKAVLRADGLTSTDHHVRESSAEELGLRGDASGDRVLASMLARTKLPGIEGDDALMTRLLTEEHVRVCRILGKLGTDTARAALKKALSSHIEAVRKAAEAALAAADASKQR